MSSSTPQIPQYENLAVSVPKKYVYHVELNRPAKSNAIDTAMWKELKECFDSLSVNPHCRAIVLSGRGKLFSIGFDFDSGLGEEPTSNDIARKAKSVNEFLELCQKGISALEECVKPVLAVVHEECTIEGIDLIAAADMRYCTEDAWFQAKQVDVAFTGDLGILQRLPKIVGNTSTVREIIYTARKFDSKEALELGLVSRVFPDKESALKQVLEIAETIAQKSPVGIHNTKRTLVYSQSRTNRDGLEYVRTINQAMLHSEDVVKAVTALKTNTSAEYDIL